MSHNSLKNLLYKVPFSMQTRMTKRKGASKKDFSEISCFDKFDYFIPKCDVAKYGFQFMGQTTPKHNQKDAA